MMRTFHFIGFLFLLSVCLAGCKGSATPGSNHLELERSEESKTGTMPVILTWDYNIFVMGPDQINQFVTSARERNISQINLRVNNKGVMNTRIKHGRVYWERLDPFGKDFDPLKVFVEECQKQGILAGVHFDLFESSYDDFFINNPQFTPQSTRDTIIYNAFPCYAHEETRQYMLDRVRDLAQYGVDRIFFCTKSSHTPRNMAEVPRNSYAAYNSPIVERYQEVFGVDILEEEPEKEKVARIHGEFLIKFLIDAKRLLADYETETIAGATLSGYLQPSGKNIFLDWRDIVEHKAADALTMSNTRGETYAWYEEGAPELFIEIAEEVKKSGMRFYGYILSTVYWDMRDRFSPADMLEFISWQMSYFHKMGADAILIHEVYQREIWDVLGNWQINQSLRQNDFTIEIPSLTEPPASFFNKVPGGDFEEKKSFWFWDVVPGWLSVLDWLPGRNSASGLNPESFDLLWSADTADNPFLHAEYDWKVMANSDFSGRSFSGRSSMLLYTDPAAGTLPQRTITWNASSYVPVVPEGNSIFSVWIHGEELSGMEAAGMKIKFKDVVGDLIDQIETTQIVEGTFSWKEIQISHKIPDRTHTIEVGLYMTVQSNAKAAGRLWFDYFKVLPSDNSTIREIEILETADAPQGSKYAGVRIEKGEEIITMPFRLLKDDGDILIFSAKTQNNKTMGVQLEINSFIYPIELSDQWETFHISLDNFPAESVVEVKIRPMQSCHIYLDDFKVAPLIGNKILLRRQK